MATILVLKGSKEEIVVTKMDEEAIAKYGVRTQEFFESKWTTYEACEQRALELLNLYKEPLITIRLSVESELVKIGDIVHFKSSTLNIDSDFFVQSFNHRLDAGGPIMDLEIVNCLAFEPDWITVIQENI